jgi:hypothetical protein
MIQLKATAHLNFAFTMLTGTPHDPFTRLYVNACSGVLHELIGAAAISVITLARKLK